MRKVDGELDGPMPRKLQQKLSLESHRRIISEMSSQETTFLAFWVSQVVLLLYKKTSLHRCFS